MRFKNLARVAVGAALGLSLTFTSVTPALAATITIDNAVSGETYTAYKLFDVTKSAGGNSYAYYTSNEVLKNALESGAGVKFTHASGTGDWYVVDDSVNAVTVANYLSSKIDNFSTWGLTRATVPATASSSSVSFDNLPAGYYFVDSSLGSLCALNTAVDTATIKEKNSVPTIDKKVWEDSADNGNGAYVDGTATIDVIDTVKYQLTVNTGTNTNGTGTGIDDNYVITDVLPEGITFNSGSVLIDGWVLNKDYTVKYEGQTLTITLLSTGKLAQAKQNQNIVITYDAGAVANLGTLVAHTNEVKLEYKEQESTDEATVKTFEIGEDAEGTPTITKVDGDNTEIKLQGVKFVLQNADGKYATFNTDTQYLNGWVDSQDAATELVTDKKGNIFAYGLDAGTYTLTETETLPGYNLLNDTITAVIDDDGNVTYELTNDNTDMPAGSITIENNGGSELPSTGGMGTTAIYIAGGALVAAAGITLVVRRRINSER